VLSGPPRDRRLLRAVEQHRIEAVRLTFDEMRIKHKTALGSLYGSVPLSRQSKAIFRTYVTEPCGGFFTALR